MATNEEMLAPKSLILPSIIAANQTLTAPTGLLAISGATIVFFNGTAWQRVTSGA